MWQARRIIAITMFRRIELIHQAYVDMDGESYPAEKGGLLYGGPQELAEAWIYELVGPARTLPSNCRFYFTEKGWREVGRNVIAAAQRAGQEYRIVAIKETDAQVVWRDKVRGYEVAVQPPKKRP
jgi:hypothetical protein